MLLRRLRETANGLRQAARRGRPFLEVLEDRCLLTLHEFGPTASNFPAGNVLGPDGNIWFVDNVLGGFFVTPVVERITPAGTLLPAVLVPGSSGLSAITVGPASDPGALYFTDSASNNIWRIDATTLALTAFPTPGSPAGIAAGADGNIWFTETATNKIGELNLSLGTITEYSSPDPSPIGITPGPVGTDPMSVWAVGTSQIIRFDLTTLTSVAYGGLPADHLPGGSFGYGISAGSDGNIWFSEFDLAPAGYHDKVGGMQPNGTLIGNFLTPMADAAPEGMTSAADGRIFFMERNQKAVAAFDPTNPNSIGESINPAWIPGPSGTLPIFITAGPGNPVTGNPDVWISELNAQKVAEYEIDGMPLRHSVPAGAERHLDSSLLASRHSGDANQSAAVVANNPASDAPHQILMVTAQLEAKPAPITSVGDQAAEQQGIDLLFASLANHVAATTVNQDALFANGLNQEPVLF